jgi:GR25 family glycosyltransferase involved in LPS biosynthesis
MDKLSFWFISEKENSEHKERVKAIRKKLINFKTKSFSFTIPLNVKTSYLNHIKLLKKALANNLDYVCIVESDVEISENFFKRELMLSLNSILQKKKDWDIIGLCTDTIIWDEIYLETEYHQLYKVKNFNSKAYIISKSGYLKILKDYIRERLNSCFSAFFSERKNNLFDKYSIFIYNPILFYPLEKVNSNLSTFVQNLKFRRKNNVLFYFTILSIVFTLFVLIVKIEN